VSNKKFASILKIFITGPDEEFFLLGVCHLNSLNLELKMPKKLFNRIAITQPRTTEQIYSNSFECGEWVLSSNDKALKVTIKGISGPNIFDFNDFTEEDLHKEIIFKNKQDDQQYIVLISAKTNKILNQASSTKSGNISSSSQETQGLELKKRKDIFKKGTDSLSRISGTDAFIAKKKEELEEAHRVIENLSFDYSDSKKKYLELIADLENKWSKKYTSLYNLYQLEINNLKREIDLKDEICKDITNDINSLGMSDYKNLEVNKKLKKENDDLKKIRDEDLVQYHKDVNKIKEEKDKLNEEIQKLKEENQNLKEENQRVKESSLVKSVKPIVKSTRQVVKPENAILAAKSDLGKRDSTTRITNFNQRSSSVRRFPPKN
jgi:hypothetical protein